MGNTTIKVPSKAQANKLAAEYLEAVIEEKTAIKRKMDAAAKLQVYCKENGTDVINGVLLPYKKAGPPILTGAEGEELTAKKEKLIKALQGTSYLNQSISMPKLFEGVSSDKLAKRALVRSGLKIEKGKTTIHFKHI